MSFWNSVKNFVTGSGGGGGGGGGGGWGNGPDVHFSGPPATGGSGFEPRGPSFPASFSQVDYAPVNNNSGGGGYRGDYSRPAYRAPVPRDPWAGTPFGNTAGYNKAVAERARQRENLFGSARDTASNKGLDIKNSILDYADSLKKAQRNVDNKAINNEMAKKQGVQGILGMVNRGVRSGGVMLANKNAGSSSAAQALANAYGSMGRQQMSSVGNQYELGNREVGQLQGDVDTQRASGTRKIADSKTQIINNIVQDFRNQIAALDAAGLNASIPDRLNIEAEKENIRGQVSQILQAYDQMLTDQNNSIKAMDRNARLTEATNLLAAGQAPEDSFNYTTEVPAQFANTGPFPSELPLFGVKKPDNTPTVG